MQDSAPMRRLLLAMIASTLALLAGCGVTLPTRYVLERDVGGWSYRRYQRVMDVEIAVAGNPAVGHTATYVRRTGRSSGAVPFANAMVAVFERPAGLAAEARRQVRTLASYEVEMRALGGGWVWHLDGGPGDRWALWVSGRHVVKVGGDGEAVPEDVVATYMGLYPSDLDPNGRARPGTPSEGELTEAETSGQSADEPHFLQENAPR